MDMPGEKLLVRLWETVNDAACGLLSPWQIRRVGRARSAVVREQKMILGQAERDAEDIRLGHKSLTANGQLVEVAEHSAKDSLREEEAPLGSVAAKTQRNLLSREIRREVNIGKAILQAETNDCLGLLMCRNLDAA